MSRLEDWKIRTDLSLVWLLFCCCFFRFFVAFSCSMDLDLDGFVLWADPTTQVESHNYAWTDSIKLTPWDEERELWSAELSCSNQGNKNMNTTQPIREGNMEETSTSMCKRVSCGFSLTYPNQRGLYPALVAFLSYRFKERGGGRKRGIHRVLPWGRGGGGVRLG